VKDDEEALLDLPREYGVDDFPLVFQTKTLNENYQIVTNMDSSGLDTALFTNGTRDAYLDAPAQIVRFRLLNGASERSFNVGLDNHETFYVIGTDGGLLEAPIALDELLISPGERYEILVDLTHHENEMVHVMNFGSTIPSGIYGTATIGGMGGSSIPYYTDNHLNGADFPLLSLHVGTQTANPISSIPSTLVSVDEWDQNEIDETRIIQFSPAVMGPNGALNGPFVFNGEAFDMNVINYEIPLNNTEIWELTNQSQISHPFHIHDVQFNILEINGETPPAHMQGWKDVVLVPPMNGTVKFITKFEDFADSDVPYMYHCHILTHEEAGMMGQFTVVGETVSVDGFDTNPNTFSLLSAYPNPFNPRTSIQFRVEMQRIVSLQIFDINGRLVKTLVNGKFSPGTHEIQWHAENQASGIYFVQLSQGKILEHQKIILLK
jgi:bilirubin oxidase